MQCKSLWIKVSAKCINVNVNYPHIFGLRRVPWRHRNAHSVKGRLFLSLKNWMNSLAFSSCPIYIGQTNRKRFWLQTVYLLRPKPRAALDHATPLHTALGDTVKKVIEFATESITSLLNPMISIKIQRRVLLTLRISEQMPLMWKPGKKHCSINAHLHHSPWI